ncbi:MAG: aldo/keto reductase family oxidoreductase [Phycisphaerales bacterium JB039]
MRTVPLGQSALRSTRLIYGCMRICGTWEPAEIDESRRREAFAALEAAVGAGYNHFDHADIYAHGECERIFGAFLSANPALRDRIIITTKCGIRWAGDPDRNAPHRYDFSTEWIRTSCERSLRRLGIDTIDVYLLHRPDVLMAPDEVAAVFDRLRASGKVRHFGVSNFTAQQTALLQSRLDDPLVCNQLEIHPLRLDPFEDGTLDDLHQRGVTPTSWGPVAGGRLFAERQDDQRLTAITAALDQEAASCGVSRTAILMAWLLRHPSGILPIVGSRTPQRIADAVAGASVDLSREAWYRIYLAARGKPLP